MHHIWVKVKVIQLCLTFQDPMVYSPPGSSLHGILQARILEWVAIPLSKGSSQPRDQTWVSCIAGKFFTVRATREAHFTLYFWWIQLTQELGITFWHIVEDFLHYTKTVTDSKQKNDLFVTKIAPKQVILQLLRLKVTTNNTFIL